MSDSTEILEELAPLEKRITDNESDSIVARWEFGNALIAQRVGKQLPKGLRTQIADKFNLGYTEIAQRMQFAEQYTTNDQVFACAETYGTWNRIKRDALPKKSSTERTDQDPKAGLGTDERAKMVLAWWRQMAKTSEQRTALAEVLRDALRDVEADIEQQRSNATNNAA